MVKKREPEKAIELAKKEGLLFAGDFAKHLGFDGEARKLWIKYIDSNPDKKEWWILRNEAEERGLIEKAVDMYKIGARLPLQGGGDYKFFEEGGNFAEEHGLLEKAKEMYLKASYAEEEKARECGDDYWGYDHFFKAIKLAMKAEKGERAKKIANETSKLLGQGLLLRNCDVLSTIEHYKKEMRRFGFTEALAIYEIKNVLRPNVFVSDSFEKAGDIAANYALGEEASRLYNLAIKHSQDSGKFDEALRIARKAGFEDKINELEQIVCVLS